jgi:hypothetical protein
VAALTDAATSLALRLISAQGGDHVGDADCISVKTVSPVQPGDEVALKAGYFVKAFRTVHVVPSQGYIVYHRKRKLKPEYQGCSQQQIIDAKKSGADINDVVEVTSCLVQH